MNEKLIIVIGILILVLTYGSMTFAIDRDYLVGEWRGTVTHTKMYVGGMEVEQQYIPDQIRGPFPSVLLVSNEGSGQRAILNNQFETTSIAMDGYAVTIDFKNYGVDSQGNAVGARYIGAISEDYNTFSGKLEIYTQGAYALSMQGTFEFTAQVIRDTDAEETEETEATDETETTEGIEAAEEVDSTVDVSFIIVRAAAKLESPLIDLSYPRGEEGELKVKARIDFYGHDLSNRKVTATGNLTIYFANYTDEEQENEGKNKLYNRFIFGIDFNPIFRL